MRAVFTELIVPRAVADEIQRFHLPAWVNVVPLRRLHAGPFAGYGLGPGETEAINLALQLKPSRLILDDGPARATAKARGLKVIGVLGVLLSAKQQGLISSIRHEVEGLKSVSFHVSPRLTREVLARAGEL